MWFVNNDLGRREKRLQPNLRWNLGICLEGLKKTTKSLSQDIDLRDEI
jgi:hypothetical protein